MKNQVPQINIGISWKLKQIKAFLVVIPKNFLSVEKNWFKILNLTLISSKKRARSPISMRISRETFN